jgi:hypothetical protein
LNKLQDCFDDILKARGHIADDVARALIVAYQRGARDRAALIEAGEAAL